MSDLLTRLPEPDGTCHCCGHALAEIEETLLCELCRPWRHAFLSIRHHFEPWVTHILREARPAMAIVSNRQELQTKPLCDDDWARLFTELGIPHKRTNYSRPSLDEGIVDRLEWLNCEGRTIVMDDNYASAYPRSEVPTSRKPRSVMAKIHTSFGTLVVTWDGVSVAGEKILGGPVIPLLDIFSLRQHHDINGENPSQYGPTRNTILQEWSTSEAFRHLDGFFHQERLRSHFIETQISNEAFGIKWPKIPPSCRSSPYGYHLIVSKSKFYENEDIPLPHDIELLCAFSDAWRGDFGHEQALLLRASILYWCHPEWSLSTHFIPEPICRSFQLLRSVIDSTPMISLFAEGIEVKGKSGTLWRVECRSGPDIHYPSWSVSSAESGNEICIYDQEKELPLGDRLLTVVLSFHDDIELAKRVDTVALEMACGKRRTAALRRQLGQFERQMDAQQEMDAQQYEVQVMPYDVENEHFRIIEDGAEPECAILDVLDHAIPHHFVHILQQEHWREYHFPEIERRVGWYL
ncbi:MAG TPA: hypothetical protein EYN88_01550 [Candidatus Poseidoniales archaeon]|nr:hypothetical protein [Candidatus Poseidoniales archaeon]